MKYFAVLFGIIFLTGIFTASHAADKLPILLEQAPSQNFEILGPVSATEKKIEDAREELLHQAQKLDADAVILKECKAGAIERNGLTWYKSQASCEGIAIRFKKQNNSPVSKQTSPHP